MSLSEVQKNNLPEELKQLTVEFLQMKNESSEFFSGLSNSDFNKRPASGGWSIGECMDHLIVTGNDYCNKFEEALKIAMKKNLLLNGELKRSWLANKFINSIEPPVKLKLRAPKRWKPETKINRSKAASAYLQLQDRWIDLVKRSAGWDIMKVKLPSPATKVIRFSAYEILGINSAHQRRHFLQVKKVKEEINN
jgi:hypothetical protein